MHWTEQQRVGDALAELGQLAQRPEANIIKLPNISASIPQLKAAIQELQSQGYALPDYPDEPQSDADRETKARYDRVKGSAVNPVLREGNSDRRAPAAVKAYAKKHPHRMGKWPKDSKAHVAHMNEGDFFANEKSITVEKATSVSIRHVARDGSTSQLKGPIALEAGEVFDGTFMSRKALQTFLAEQVADARQQGVLFSLHLKATMMKVSDPILFGHAVRAYFADVFDEARRQPSRSLGVDPNNGSGDVLAKIQTLPAAERDTIRSDRRQLSTRTGPGLAMVDSDNDITNLHVPSDVIIDASMPVVDSRLRPACGTPPANPDTAKA